MGSCTISWTRATLLYHIGTERHAEYLDLLIDALSDSEALVRETALWSMAQIDPPALQSWVYSLQKDPDPAVRAVAKQIHAEA